jgi:hypothetical protein
MSHGPLARGGRGWEGDPDRSGRQGQRRGWPCHVLGPCEAVAQAKDSGELSRGRTATEVPQWACKPCATLLEQGRTGPMANGLPSIPCCAKGWRRLSMHIAALDGYGVHFPTSPGAATELVEVGLPLSNSYSHYVHVKDSGSAVYQRILAPVSWHTMRCCGLSWSVSGIRTTRAPGIVDNRESLTC